MLPLPSSSLCLSNKQQAREKYSSRICPSSSGCSVHLVIRCRWHSSKTPKTKVGWYFTAGLGSSPLQLSGPTSQGPSLASAPGLQLRWSNGNIWEQRELAAHHAPQHRALGRSLSVRVTPFSHPSHQCLGELETSRREVGTYAIMRWWGRRRKTCVQFQGFGSCFPWGAPLA